MGKPWYLLPLRCVECGRFVSERAPGVSWRQLWSYGMDGCPELGDVTYRCSPCTDKYGVRGTNCTPPEQYSGRNPLETPA